MTIALEIEAVAFDRQKPMNDVIDRGDSDVQRFYQGTTVFITGGSGFIGKVLIEKLLRSCKINKIFMLIRSKKGNPVNKRLPEILKDSIFDSLRNNKPEFLDKIVPVEGDVTDLGLGISDEDKKIITKEVEIIFHAAATVAFDEPIRSATLTNIRGTREIINLAKLCPNLKSLVYISTAYSNATSSKAGTVVMEQFYPCPVSPSLVIELVETLEEDRLNDIKPGLVRGWPNTYSFTKAVAEELVRSSAGDLPICIVRPSIVISANREPLPGWIDINSVYGPSGLLFGATMGVIHVIYASQEVKIDFVPVDYVVNAAVVAAVTAKEHPMRIYNVSSSCRNHITWANMAANIKIIGNNLISPKAVWYCFAFQTSSRWVYNILALQLHHIPAYLMDGVAVLLGQSPKFKKLYSKIDKLVTTLSFYVTNDWIFNDSNTDKMYQSLSDVDKIIYHCDVSDIDWKNQIYLWSIGLRKYIVKDGLKDTSYGMKKQFYLKIVTYFIYVLYFYVLWLFFKLLFMFF